MTVVEFNTLIDELKRLCAKEKWVEDPEYGFQRIATIVGDKRGIETYFGMQPQRFLSNIFAYIVQ